MRLILSLAGVCFCVSILAAAEKEPRGKEDTVVWAERVVPGPSVMLRLKRNVGKSLIYDGTLERSQQSANSYTENDSFLLNVLTADKKDIIVKDARKRLDLVAIWRTFTERHRSEILENKKQVDRVLENSNDLINLGPNFEMVGALRCYGFDSQNSVAFATQQVLTTKDGRQVHGRVLTETNDKLVFLSQEEKIELKKADIEKTETIPIPHVLLNETPHYMFPIFSQRQVAPGETWKFRVPVIIPLEQGNPPRLLPTQFTAVMIGRLREVRNSAEGQIATVDYQVHGEFDSNGDEYSTRFPEEFRSNNRIVHKIAGDGSVTVDVEKGRILSKSETFSITLYALAVVPQGAGQEPKRDENQADIVSKFSINLVPPGTKLKNGAVIPSYDEDAPLNEDGTPAQKVADPDRKDADRDKKKDKNDKKDKEKKKPAPKTESNDIQD